MKRLLYICCLIPLLLACQAETILPPAKVTRHQLWVYQQQLSVSDSLSCADMAYSGDTLYLLNEKEGYRRLEMRRASDFSLLRTLKGGTEGAFMDRPTALLLSHGRIFVAGMNSRVDIFDQTTFEHLCTVGTGAWWGDDNFRLVHAFALAVADGKLFIRDKESVRAYKLSDCIKANNKKVPMIAKTPALGYNSSSQPHGMAVLDKKIFVTDYVNRRIQVIDPTMVQAGKEIFLLQEYALTARPLGLTISADELWVTLDTRILQAINPESGKMIRSFQTFSGGSWQRPDRVGIWENRLYMRDKGVLLQGRKDYIEISEYE